MILLRKYEKFFSKENVEKDNYSELKSVTGLGVGGALLATTKTGRLT